MNNVGEHIIKRINKGDVKAYEQLYSIFHVYLCAVATKYIYNTELAKEIVQDVFLSVWNNHESLTYPIKAYLIKATQNKCLNYLRKQHFQEMPLTDLQEQIIAHDPHPLEQLENKEIKQSIFDAIQKLPTQCRRIFMQYIYENKSYEEIAKTTQLAPSTVRVQIKIAITKLKGMLNI